MFFEQGQLFSNIDGPRINGIRNSKIDKFTEKWKIVIVKLNKRRLSSKGVWHVKNLAITNKRTLK